MITRRYLDSKVKKPKVSLSAIIKETELEYYSDPGSIKPSTIWKRLHRLKNISQDLPGLLKSPLHDVEPTLVAIAL